MVFSPLTARSVGTRKFNDIGKRSVDRLIVRHTAGGTNAGNVALLSSGAREVSATYSLLTTAELVGIVPEEYRPWTSNAPGIDADRNSVTVETVNTGGAPGWPVSDAQVEKLAQLAAELCRRYSWGTVTRTRVIGHQEVGVSTACPGPYLLPRLDSIVRRVNEIRTGAAPAVPTSIERRKLTFLIDTAAYKDDKNAPGHRWAIVGPDSSTRSGTRTRPTASPAASATRL